MKKRLTNILILLTVLVSLSGCGLLSKIFTGGKPDNTEIVAGQSMYMKTYNFSPWQLDSLCSADNLPRDLDEGWIRRSFNDFETQTMVVRYMYIKDLNDNYEMIYLVTPKGDMYIVSKRKVVMEEE